jgi:hypothetical protein
MSSSVRRGVVDDIVQKGVEMSELVRDDDLMRDPETLNFQLSFQFDRFFLYGFSELDFSRLLRETMYVGRRQAVCAERQACRTNQPAHRLRLEQ